MESTFYSRYFDYSDVDNFKMKRRSSFSQNDLIKVDLIDKLSMIFESKSQVGDLGVKYKFYLIFHSTFFNKDGLVFTDFNKKVSK